MLLWKWWWKLTSQNTWCWFLVDFFNYSRFERLELILHTLLNRKSFFWKHILNCWPSLHQGVDLMNPLFFGLIDGLRRRSLKTFGPTSSACGKTPFSQSTNFGFRQRLISYQYFSWTSSKNENFFIKYFYKFLNDSDLNCPLENPCAKELAPLNLKSSTSSPWTTNLTMENIANHSYNRISMNACILCYAAEEKNGSSTDNLSICF